MIVDAGFIVLVVLIALLTPKASAYRAINYVLVGEFVATLAIVQLSKLAIDNVLYVDLLKIIKDVIFIFIFYKVGGIVLAKVQGWIASFHVALAASVLLSTSLLADNYSLIMGGFCAAQLLCGVRGALHGFVCNHFVIDSGGAYHRRRNS